MAVTQSCPGTGHSPDDDTARFPPGLASAVAQPWPPVPGSSTAGQTTPKKQLGAEEMDGWEVLGKKLLLCLHGWCLILEPLSHPSVAQGTPPPRHLSWGWMESPPWRTFLQCCGWIHYNHGRVWRNPWKPPRHWEHWSCTRGPCLCSWLPLCCCRHIWVFGLVRGCPCVRIILSLQGYSTRELCNPFVWTMPWEATTGQNQMTWGCFFPGPLEDTGRCSQPGEMRALQRGRFGALSLSCSVASSLWSCWRCLLGQAP